MNKSARENCIPKCIVVSLEKNPQVVDFYKTDYQNILPKDRKLQRMQVTFESL